MAVEAGVHGTATKVLVGLLLVTLAGGQVAGDNDARKVKTRVEPAYPDLARQNHLAGTVRIEIVVAHDGSVKTTKPLGGHPLLVQAAELAVKKWRYEPGPETTLVIEFHFHQN